MNRSVHPLGFDRLNRVKIAFTARRVPRTAYVCLLEGEMAPRAGDLVLARVDRLRQHRRLELVDGRKAQLFVGDEIVVSFGNRYAPDQFEAIVPDDLGPCHLVAGGGVAARTLSKHEGIKSATNITPLGLLGGADGKPINLADWKLSPLDPKKPRPMTLAVIGTSMNSGKTTTAANLIRGLVSSGQKVGAAKITGTGSGGDPWFMVDAGAWPVFDFTDAGLPSTSMVPVPELVEVSALLCNHLSQSGVDAIVIEIADGICQPETAGLLSLPQFTSGIDGVFFAASDALGASAGAAWLQQRGLQVLAVRGVFTSSPLAIREAEVVTGLPAMTAETLSSPATAASLVDRFPKRAEPYLQGTEPSTVSPIPAVA